MMDARKKRQFILLFSLLGILAISVYWSFIQGTSSSEKGLPSQPAGVQKTIREDLLTFEKVPGQAGRKKEILIGEIDPSIHLERLNSFQPGTPEITRNMFVLGPAPVVRQPQKPGPAGVGAAPGGGPVGTAPNPSPPPPPAVVISLKYIGYKVNEAQKSRRGFFAEGDNVFFAGEGEIIASRYRVVRIQNTSAEIEYIPTRTRQQLNLVVQ
jgi:hypothetical protein